VDPHVRQVDRGVCECRVSLARKRGLRARSATCSVPHASGVTNLDAAWDEPRLDEGPALYTKTMTVCVAR
jgi:hypothetical protein